MRIHLDLLAAGHHPVDIKQVLGSYCKRKKLPSNHTTRCDTDRSTGSTRLVR
ncbi:hypothetical protein CXB77_05560 (plasmid) [Chromatium okenii]|uniref:Uncharacterized protein n=1 Tax=Chromatium okenii TaxID=61644 RepID=A0A2S7XU12_9GAMM|nr:hypothetical protein CXB77_05560 [Chromatium okenii]